LISTTPSRAGLCALEDHLRDDTFARWFIEREVTVDGHACTVRGSGAEAVDWLVAKRLGEIAA
jgi:hypothetical protein